MELEKLLLKLIEQKYKEVQSKQQSGIFEKILHFEGNAIGQIGEKFIKEVCIITFVDKKRDYEYIHDRKREFIKINDKYKQLVAMNPGNQVNFKLTLNLEELKPIRSLCDDLVKIFSF